MTKEALQLKEIQELRSKQQDSISLFKILQTQVGLTHGEMIAEHIAGLNGQTHNANNWDFTDKNGEQGR